MSLGLPPKHIVDFGSGFAIEIIYRDLLNPVVHFTLTK